MIQGRVSHPVLLRERGATASIVMITAGLCLSAPLQLRAAAPTTTAMTLTVNGSPVASVEQHTSITLTAAVKAGVATLKLGQVKFCDATVKYCEDNHLLGIAQLTSAGTAILRTAPSPGTHNYKAVFAGTTGNASSSSAAETLTVTGSSPTTAAIAAVGSGGAYTLTGTLRATAGGLAPTGELYFLDRTDSAGELGKASLATGIAPSLSWTQAVNEPLLNGIHSTVAIGDFNNDGHPDFLLSKQHPTEVQLYTGDGTGHFVISTAASGDLSGYGDSVVADFNNDGNQDFALALPGQQLLIYLGNGDGTFSRGAFTLKLGYTDSLLTADFDHDGNADLAFAESDSVTVLFGNSDGTFTAGVRTSLVENRYGLLVGDFDGDGYPDLATVDTNSTYGGIIILYGSGDRSFTKKKVKSGQFGTFQAADFNGDGRTDLLAVAALPSAPLGVNVMLGNPDRTLTVLPHVVLVDRPYPGRILLGDFDGDGNTDAAFSLQGKGGTIPIEILRGDGAGGLTPAGTVNNGVAKQAILLAAADFDEDGTSDISRVLYPQIQQETSYQVLLTQLNYSASVSGKPPIGPGTHQVVARYDGDSNFNRSASSPIALSPLTTSAPVATFSTLAIPFGAQPVGAPGNAKTVQLTNTGAAALHLNSFSLVPAPDKGLSFASLNNCPASLAAGASCKIRIRFVPGSPARKMTSLVITDNAANSPQTITLTGTGTDEP